MTYNLNENFNLPSYLVAISKIIKFVKRFKNYDKQYIELLIETLIIFTPVIPHFTAECWSRLKPNLPFDTYDKVSIEF